MDDRLKLYSQKQLFDLFKKGNKIFGVSKSHPTIVKDIPQIDALRGTTGEQIVSGILNLNALDLEEFYVCHSIGTHDDSQGETDHVVIYKNKIIIIETKTYNAYRRISVNAEGTAIGFRGNKEFKIPDNKIMNKVKLYQKRFPNREVEGILAVARYGITTKSSHKNYSVVSLKDLQTRIETIVSQAQTIKEDAWPAVKFFSSLCIREYT